MVWLVIFVLVVVLFVLLTQVVLIYIWNPFTQQSKMLPTTSARGPCPQTSLGFGFDSTSNDYKLLRITVSISHWDRYVNDIIYVLEAELYSSNAGYWKEINVPETVRSKIICTNSKCVHDLKTGVLFFKGARELISFDLHNEVFGVYPFPIPTSVLHYPKSDVLDFEGSVALIFESSIGDGSVLSLWTLDDVCDNKVSWTKKFNLEADMKIDWVSLYLGVGQFVAKNDVVGNIFYDYKKKDTQKFLSPPPPAPSADAPTFREYNSVVKYTESLVSV